MTARLVKNPRATVGPIPARARIARLPPVCQPARPRVHRWRRYPGHRSGAGRSRVVPRGAAPAWKASTDGAGAGIRERRGAFLPRGTPDWTRKWTRPTVSPVVTGNRNIERNSLGDGRCATRPAANGGELAGRLVRAPVWRQVVPSRTTRAQTMTCSAQPSASPRATGTISSRSPYRRRTPKGVRPHVEHRPRRGEDPHPAQGTAQTYRLHGRVLDLRLHHQEVQVAARPGVAPRLRAESANSHPVSDARGKETRTLPHEGKQLAGVDDLRHETRVADVVSTGREPERIDRIAAREKSSHLHFSGVAGRSANRPAAAAFGSARRAQDCANGGERHHQRPRLGADRREGEVLVEARSLVVECVHDHSPNAHQLGRADRTSKRVEQ